VKQGANKRKRQPARNSTRSNKSNSTRRAPRPDSDYDYDGESDYAPSTSRTKKAHTKKPRRTLFSRDFEDDDDDETRLEDTTDQDTEDSLSSQPRKSASQPKPASTVSLGRMTTRSTQKQALARNLSSGASVSDPQLPCKIPCLIFPQATAHRSGPQAGESPNIQAPPFDSAAFLKHADDFMKAAHSMLLPQDITQDYAADIASPQQDQRTGIPASGSNTPLILDYEAAAADPEIAPDATPSSIQPHVPPQEIPGQIQQLEQEAETIQEQLCQDIISQEELQSSALELKERHRMSHALLVVLREEYNKPATTEAKQLALSKEFNETKSLLSRLRHDFDITNQKLKDNKAVIEKKRAKVGELAVRIQILHDPGKMDKAFRLVDDRRRQNDAWNSLASAEILEKVNAALEAGNRLKATMLLVTNNPAFPSN